MLCIILFIMNVIADDWRGDPCSRAGIPWSTPRHARLDPTHTSRFISRVDHTRFLRVEERVHLRRGEEEVIHLDFQIKVSDDSVHGAINVVQEGDEVAMTIDGSAITSEECVKADIYVYLPPKVYAFTVDTSVASIEADGVRTSFDKLGIISRAGSVSLLDSAIDAKVVEAEIEVGSFTMKGVKGEIEQLEVKIKSGRTHIESSAVYTKDLGISSHVGSVTIGEGLVADKVHVEIGSGSCKAALPIREVVNVTSSVGRIDLTGLPSSYMQSSKVDIEASSGSIQVAFPSTENKIDFEARTAIGSINLITSYDASVAATFTTTLGSVNVPRELVITRQSRTITGRHIEGHLGHEPALLEMRASAKSGSVNYRLQNFVHPDL